MDHETLSALAEPTRLKIVELLVKQPLTVGDIASHLQIRQPQASKHLRNLHDAGIVEVQAIANRRIYRLRAQPFQELDRWLITYRQLWEDRFDQLDAYLRQLQQTTHESTPTQSPPADKSSEAEQP
ncbi:ArsR/SmtB family transcription factor [Deinococcus hohokamensis]|uniref:ArsR/SmtB family transcription factor n=1 Tax=Deinococcus hohokamensis TaxID=309883 RepID=A0ABV9IF45_9DEIO